MEGEPKDLVEAAKWRLERGIPLTRFHEMLLAMDGHHKQGSMDPVTKKEWERLRARSGSHSPPTDSNGSSSLGLRPVRPTPKPQITPAQAAQQRAKQEKEPEHSGFAGPGCLMVGGLTMLIVGFVSGQLFGCFFGVACLLLAAYHHGQNTRGNE